ncbi:MAG TPA: porin [Candidatus Angelobacter sp.]|nr:porin [Candidatus Angelobacter sp.]
MRSSALCGLLCFALLTPTLFAGDRDPADRAPEAANNANTNANASASNANASPVTPPEVTVVKSDIDVLRRQLADQQKTIERLQAVIDQLAAKAGVPATDASSANVAAPVAVPASFINPAVRFPSATGDGEDTMYLMQPEAKKDAPLPSAGWNGEHFYLRSPDGTFTLLPLGYLNTNYSFYQGDGAPPNTFTVRRARFGFLGTYGSKVDYAFLFDAANTAASGIAVRDMYLNFKPIPQFQIQAGQFKEPFSQEIGTGITNVEFLERSIVTVLYPSAAGVFRAPGVSVHGDLDGGVVQYWAGIFNGKGIVQNNTTNEVETVERLRFAPWKKSKDGLLKGLIIGGSYSHGRSRGLNINNSGGTTSPELSFNGTINDSAYSFFPQFRINGAIQRYNGEFLYLRGPWGLRGEYTQILEKRDGVGALAPGGIGFQTLPGVVGKGAYLYTTYLLSGEREPENAIPRVKHPVIGPPTPGVDGGSPGWGAWQLKFRYSWLEGKAGGQNFPNAFTPESVPAFSDHTDQFSMGFNWYLNYWVLLKVDLNVDRLRNPSVQGILPQNYYVAVQGLQFRF